MFGTNNVGLLSFSSAHGKLLIENKNWFHLKFRHSQQDLLLHETKQLVTLTYQKDRDKFENVANYLEQCAEENCVDVRRDVTFNFELVKSTEITLDSRLLNMFTHLTCRAGASNIPPAIDVTGR